MRGGVYGIALPAGLLERFSWVTRLHKEEVSDMLLSSYDGVVLDLSELSSPEPPRYRYARLSFKQWAYFVGSHVCPSCLAGTSGVWRLAWKLPWSFACARHLRLLADTCPSCDSRIGLENTEVSSFAASSWVLKPTACRHFGPRGTMPGRRNRGPCGYSLETIETERLDPWPRLVEAQRSLNEAMLGVPQRVLDEEVPSLGWFSDLRSVCAMLLYLGIPEDLGAAPRAVEDAFARYAEERDGVRELRGEPLAANSPRSRERKRRIRPYSQTPQSAALVAAIVPEAIDILEASSPQELTLKLEPFALRARKLTRHVDEVFLSFLSFSSRLEGAFIECWNSVRAHNMLVVGSHGRRTVDKDLLDLTPDHVPQLLWQSAYAELFASLLPDVEEGHARRVCSMALLKVTGRYTWKSAAEALDLPGERCSALARRTIWALNKRGARDIFESNARSLARRIVDDPDRVDYGSRRRLLANFEIPPDDWRDICEASGINPGRGARRRCASAWLWSYLTGGDYRLSPQLRNASSKAREDYKRKFVAGILEQVRCCLIDYGSRLAVSPKPRQKASEGGGP